MNPPCIVMVEKILPEMRKRVAKQLRDRGWSQTDIARMVGVTQPMISKYLRSINETMSESIESEIERGVNEIIKITEKNGKEREIIEVLCRMCFSIREKGLLCQVHPVEACRVCMNIRTGNKALERRALMDDFKKALGILEGRLPRSLIPEVRINIAAALPGAENREEVLAVPGRLVEIDGEIKALTEPEFGASRHLSGILLRAMKKRGNLCAVVNIGFDEYIRDALENLKICYKEFDGEHLPDGWQSEFLLDPGAYGREPCLYIFGKSAEDAALKVKMIAEAVKY